MNHGDLDANGDPQFNKMHVFSYTKLKAGMNHRTEEQLHQMMKEMKISNKNYYLLKEKKV